jgi:hypothetical protein
LVTAHYPAALLTVQARWGFLEFPKRAHVRGAQALEEDQKAAAERAAKAAAADAGKLVDTAVAAKEAELREHREARCPGGCRAAPSQATHAPAERAAARSLFLRRACRPCGRRACRVAGRAEIDAAGTPGGACMQAQARIS